MPKGHTKPSSVQWPLMVSKETISWACGGLRFGSSGEAARLVARGDSLPVELGARLELLEQLRVLAHLPARPECVGPQRLGLQSLLGRHAWLPTCCDSGLEETTLHAFYYCERVRPFWNHIGEWTARISPKQLVLFDVVYVIELVVPVCTWVYAASLVVRKGAMLEPSFPPLPANGDDGPGPSGPHPE